MTELGLVLLNIRSLYNVGSLLRTADGFGVNQVWCVGFTPYPSLEGDQRLPHERRKIDNALRKTALGAEQNLVIHHAETLEQVAEQNSNYQLVAIEQSSSSTALPNFKPVDRTLLVLGSEPTGLTEEDLALCSATVEIPMLGQKESFNVAVAGAIVLYHCRHPL